MSERIRKINELIREEAGKAIAENISSRNLITVTAVETAPNLRRAVVWVSVLGNSEEAMEQIQAKKSEITHEITGIMTTKYTPKIEFKLDKSQEHIQRIEELLSDEEDK